MLTSTIMVVWMGLEHAVDGQEGFVPLWPLAQGWFGEGLGDSRREELFCRKHRCSRELVVLLFTTDVGARGPVPRSLRSFS